MEAVDICIQNNHLRVKDHSLPGTIVLDATKKQFWEAGKSHPHMPTKNCCWQPLALLFHYQPSQISIWGSSCCRQYRIKTSTSICCVLVIRMTVIYLRQQERAAAGRRQPETRFSCHLFHGITQCLDMLVPQFAMLLNHSQRDILLLLKWAVQEAFTRKIS